MKRTLLLIVVSLLSVNSFPRPAAPRARRRCKPQPADRARKRCRFAA